MVERQGNCEDFQHDLHLHFPFPTYFRHIFPLKCNRRSSYIINGLKGETHKLNAVQNDSQESAILTLSLIIMSEMLHREYCDDMSDQERES